MSSPAEHAAVEAALDLADSGLGEPCADCDAMVKAVVDKARVALAALVAQAEQAQEALRQIRDTAKWYGEGERLEHEIHHALVVEVYATADNALAPFQAHTGDNT